MTGARATVAVVSWNTRELLASCLASLAADAEAGIADVWVVDNDSADGSAAMVAERFGWASLIAAGENLGFGPAVNLVASRTRAPWLVAANADVEVTPGALSRLLDAGDLDAGLGAVAPRLITRDGDVQHSVHSFPTVTLQALSGIGAHRFVPGLGERLCVEGSWDASRARDVDWAHAALLAVRRAAFDEVGGFDPGQWLYAEDLDLAWRLRAAGWRLRYEPAAAVRHVGSAAAIQAYGGDRMPVYMAATYDWMRRRRGPVVTWAFGVVSVLAAGARWLVYATLARAGGRRFRPGRDAARAWTRAHAAGLRGREGARPR